MKIEELDKKITSLDKDTLISLYLQTSYDLKNVRKQVCDDIRDKFIHILNINDGHYSYEQLDDDFNNILDQIEKGDKE